MAIYLVTLKLHDHRAIYKCFYLQQNFNIDCTPPKCGELRWEIIRITYKVLKFSPKIIKHPYEGRKEMFYLTTHSTHFYLRLYGVGHIVKDHSDSERGNLMPTHGRLFPINSKGYFIWTLPQTG